MCWSNYMAIPIVLKKPLRVYKVGTSTTFDNFISLFQDYVYHKCQTVPTVEINPKFERLCPDEELFNPAWYYDCFYIHRLYSVISMIYIQEAYHSYTKIQYTFSRIYKKDSIYTGKRIIFGNQLREIILDNPYYVATFVIPKGAMYIINTKGEIVSNQIIYTGRYLKL